MTVAVEPDERVRIFGIRHHGPGSARALRKALEDFKPEVILIEGPPEADPIVALAADPGMVPPVALLAYVSAEGEHGDRRAAFWPFAEFSPEWQAIRHALAAGVPVRFCDLPAAHQLAEPPDDHSGGVPGADPGPAGPETPGREDAEALEQVRLDPLGTLAEAAGYDDAERWWDDVVEHRGDGPAPFEAIAEAMTTLREHAPPMPEGHALREERREAYMRKTLRRALKDGFERVAVVCGAWHVPAIAAGLGSARDQGAVTATGDDRTLRGLPKTRVALTWVPWTHGRLAGRSGYGAGVRSPGWYHHLFSEPDRPIERWLTEAARVLRDEDLPVSSAHVIEAVRLADALAALRGRPLAGLDEVTEATLAVLCEGAELPAQLIQRRMVVGERLGAVPDSTPMVPLQHDLRAEQRRLRLRPSALEKEHDLDLRKPTDLDRSRLLHRLRLLEVPWGEPAESGRGKGTFRETWTLLWRPVFDVELIEASAWGTTVRGAASAKARSAAAGAEALTDLTSLAERCLLADLDDALPDVMRTLADRAAADTAVAHLMAALPALVRTLRYGDVRGTSTGPLRTVVDGLVVRVCVGLPPAASGIDDDAARTLLDRVDEVHDALALLDDAEHLARWRDTLAGLIDRPGLHGLIEGRLTRLLLDAGRLERVADRMARAVSVGESPARAAAWIEGFLAGGGLVLVHDDALLRLVDGWIAGLSPEWFTDVLPLLRRTFAEFEAPERRSIGERVRHLGSGDRAGRAPEDPGDDDWAGLDAARVGPAGQTIMEILGWSPSSP
ncbi:DUF5682 family protein [Actinomadura alba]|uniref:Uncharacterized protein n=1 Tax=Actinomadura alba TaxID=406431 RepID=A0ABR7LUM3_9ACTN|nr:DUF5682 family protein [Actinomadura alba]MBC6468192.1 hypothetical protein [Actinomadura alba]